MGDLFNPVAVPCPPSCLTLAAALAPSVSPPPLVDATAPQQRSPSRRLVTAVLLHAPLVHRSHMPLIFGDRAPGSIRQ